MDSIDIGGIVSQLPNFLGLLIAIYSQWQIIQLLTKRLDSLVDTIIKGENCPDDNAPK